MPGSSGGRSSGAFAEIMRAILQSILILCVLSGSIRGQTLRDRIPYPDGATGLPNNPDPKILDSIHLGQSPEEVSATMGRAALGNPATGADLLGRMKTYYEHRNPSHADPKGIDQLKDAMTPDSRYFIWNYQGFPTTADWIVIVFRVPEEAPDSKAQVIAKGIFGLGCF